MNDKIAVMFTGGLDSTVVACELLNNVNNIVLLTFNNNICMRLSKVDDRVKELTCKYKTKNIEFFKIDIKNTIKFLMNAYLKSSIKIKSPLIFDLICRFSMEINAIIYCKKHGILTVADGNNFAQGQIFIQQKKYLDIVDDFYMSYGIKSLHPIFDTENRNVNLQYLKNNNFNVSGSRLFPKLGISSQFLQQPFCLWAFVAFLFTSPIRKCGFEKLLGLSVNEAIKVRTFLQNKSKIYINERIKNE